MACDTGAVGIRVCPAEQMEQVARRLGVPDRLVRDHLDGRIAAAVSMPTRGRFPIGPGHGDVRDLCDVPADVRAGCGPRGRVHTGTCSLGRCPVVAGSTIGRWTARTSRHRARLYDRADGRARACLVPYHVLRDTRRTAL